MSAAMDSTSADEAERARTLLTDLRASIDNIDAALVHMLAERFRCTKAVGVLKAEHGLPPADPARERQQIARLRRLADDAQLDPDIAEKFLAFIIREVIQHHVATATERAKAYRLGDSGGESAVDPASAMDEGTSGSDRDDHPSQMN